MWRVCVVWVACHKVESVVEWQGLTKICLHDTVLMYPYLIQRRLSWYDYKKLV